MFRNLLGGLLYVAIIFVTSFFGCIIKIGPLLPLMLLKPSWFRWITDKLLRTWLPFPTAILEIFCGTKLFITTESFSHEFKNNKTLIIMNHRTRLDWLYYFSVLMRHGNLEYEKIILKNELKHIPGAGWVMQICMFLFLQRKWENDEKYLHKILHYYTDIDYPLQLLLFPEGTDYDPNTLAKSKSYAVKNNLPIYNHVLHPRLRGFTYCMQELQRRNAIDAIHDVTVGYHGTLCRSELDMVMGNFPQEVHFHIKRYPIAQIPESVEGLEKWCSEKWAEKEERLERFYKNGKFDSDEKAPKAHERYARFQHILCFGYWMSFAFIVPYFVYHYSWFRWYVCVVSLVFFFLSTFGGGFENLQIWRHSISNKYSDHQNNYPSYSYLDHSFSNGKPRGE